MPRITKARLWVCPTMWFKLIGGSVFHVRIKKAVVQTTTLRKDVLRNKSMVEPQESEDKE